MVASLRDARTALVLLCLLLPAAGGCKKRVQATPPTTTGPAETTPPAPSPEETKPETKPETKSETSPAPSAPTLVVPPAKPAPAKPRSASPEPATPRPAPPQISPRLSPTEQAEIERRTNEDIRIAERNLQVAYGKQLNATQHDLVEKIRGFLAQAREAIRASDWVRARNLAQKAQLLSVELINSR